MKSLRARPGMTLLEALMTITLIAICLLALLSNSIASIVSTRDASERAAAIRAARLKLEEIASTRFDDIPKFYKTGAPGDQYEFDVVLEYLPSGKNRFLPGLKNPANLNTTVPAGEVIVVCNEGWNKTNYGRDLTIPADGIPDGINFQGLPIDLNCNGNTSDGDVSGPNQANRFPVGIVIRWYGAGGREERYELWTIISRLQ